MPIRPEMARPRIICLENVEEFQHWGPLANKLFSDQINAAIDAAKGESNG